MSGQHLDWELCAYLDGELEAAEAERVEGHLGGCVACREALAELRAAAELWARRERAPVRPFFLTRLEGRLARETEREGAWALVEGVARWLAPVLGGLSAAGIVFAWAMQPEASLDLDVALGLSSEAPEERVVFGGEEMSDEMLVAMLASNDVK
jgi:anti-sigma factor RsiW